MNTRSAGRELAFLSISQLSRSAELTPEKLILSATRTLKDVAKGQIKKVQKNLQELGEFFFNEALNKEENSKYQIDLNHLHEQVGRLELAAFNLKESLDLPELLNQPPEAFNHAVFLINAYRLHKEKINKLISEVLEQKKSLSESKGWSLERILSIDRDILRIACAELIENSDCPSVVVIDEALELAKKYGTEESPKFVNGVLVDLINKIQLP